MDTRKKPRSGGERRPDRSNNRAKGTPAPKGNPQRRPEQRRQAPDQRRSRQPMPSQEPKQEAERREQLERRRREAARQAQNAQRRHQAAAQSTEEVVFKMDGSQNGKQRQIRDSAAAKRSQQRRRSAARAQERKKQAQRRSRAPKVVYTQPRPFQVRKLLLQLGIVAAVVAAVMLGLSLFFRVEQVMVYGNKAYSAWTILETSGIETGERLLSINNARACGKIKTLPYVNKVRIGINLPDTVNIYIEEFDVVYAIQSQNDIWWLMTSGGWVVEQTDGGTAGNYTKVLGVKLDNPVAGENAVAYEEIQTQTDTAGATDPSGIATEPPVTVTAADQLRTALTILDTLEANDLVGTAASVDVSNTADIELWYGTRYQVRLGSMDRIEYKISCMKQAVAQQSEYETGILDVSFTSWENQVGYTPFQ